MRAVLLSLVKVSDSFLTSLLNRRLTSRVHNFPRSRLRRMSDSTQKNSILMTQLYRDPCSVYDWLLLARENSKPSNNQSETLRNNDNIKQFIYTMKNTRLRWKTLKIPDVVSRAWGLHIIFYTARDALEDTPCDDFQLVSCPYISRSVSFWHKLL